MDRVSTLSFWSMVGIAGIASTPALAAIGDVILAPPVAHPVSSVTIGVTIADIDADGALDVITADSQDISLLVNGGDGTFAAPVHLDIGGGDPRLALVGDLDGDGNADMVTSVRSGNGTIAVLLATAPGVFAPAVQYGAEAFSFVPAMDDFDGDGDLDVAVVLGTSVRVLFNAGNGTFPESTDYGVFDAPVVYTADLAAADVDGDNAVDLIVVNDCPLGCDVPIALLRNAGDGTFLAPVGVDLGIESAGAVRAEDLDGDGDIDLALVDCDFPGSDLVIALNDGGGSFVEHSRSDTGRNCAGGAVTTPEGIVLVDLDSDGHLDAALTSRTDDTIRVIRNDGNLSFGAALTFSVGDQPIAIAAGDLNDDGRPDLATADMGIGSTPTATVLINETPAPCPADLDGSGGVDVGDVLMLLGAWGTSGPGDLDGNGIVDVADILIMLAAWGGCA